MKNTNQFLTSTSADRKISPIWGLGGPMNPLYFGPYMCKDWIWRRIRKTY